MILGIRVSARLDLREALQRTQHVSGIYLADSSKATGRIDSCQRLSGEHHRELVVSPTEESRYLAAAPALLNSNRNHVDRYRNAARRMLTPVFNT